MIQFHFKRLLADKEFKEKKTISIRDVAKKTSISRVTLSKIANSKGTYNTTTDIIERLCLYFGCTPNDFMTIMTDQSASDDHQA